MNKRENKRTPAVICNRILLESVVGTLKLIKVDGYESMDRLVGCVITLENVLRQSVDLSDDSDEPADGVESEDEDG